MSRLRSLLLVAVASSLDLASAFAPSALGAAARRSDATVRGDADARSVELEESITSGTSAEASLVEPSAWRSLALGMALGVFAAFCVARPAMALPNLAKGEEIFLGNCAACHAAGRNAVQPDKTLQKAALEQYGMYDVDRIKYQVTNGKNAMPAFGERVSSQDIDDVSNYIMVMAEKGWTSSS